MVELIEIKEFTLCGLLNYLKQIYNWTPKVFNETNEDDIYDDAERAQYRKMPQFLKDAITNTNAEEVSAKTVEFRYFFCSVDIFLKCILVICIQKKLAKHGLGVVRR